MARPTIADVEWFCHCQEEDGDVSMYVLFARVKVGDKWHQCHKAIHPMQIEMMKPSYKCGFISHLLADMQVYILDYINKLFANCCEKCEQPRAVLWVGGKSPYCDYHHAEAEHDAFRRTKSNVDARFNVPRWNAGYEQPFNTTSTSAPFVNVRFQNSNLNDMLNEFFKHFGHGAPENPGPRINWSQPRNASDPRRPGRFDHIADVPSPDEILLGVDSGAPAETIKAAYHKLALKYHPDRPTGDQAKMKEVNAAYARLMKDR